MWLKDVFKNSVSWTNTHHGITDLINHGMVKRTKTWISWEQYITYLQNKKIVNLCHRWHILRSLVVEVTFKNGYASLSSTPS